MNSNIVHCVINQMNMTHIIGKGRNYLLTGM